MMASSLLLWVGILVPVACLAGLASGLLGIGGGIVLIPALYFIFSEEGSTHVALHSAIGTSLAIVVITTLSAARAHYKRGVTDMRIIKKWAPYLSLGAVLGGALAGSVSDILLSAIFGLGLMPLVALLFWGPEPDTHPDDSLMPKGVKRGAIASSVGFASSLTGVGGGSFGVPALVLCGQPIHWAVGTAAAFGPLIAFPGSLVLLYAGLSVEGLPPYSWGYVNYAAIIICAPLTILFAPLGARLAHATPQKLLRRLFGLFVFVIALRFLIRAFF